MRWAILLLLGAVILGCQGLKDKQLGAYIGDSQTKIFYKNTTELHNQIPQDRQIMFDSMDAAMKAGYTSSAEAGDQAAPESE